MSVVSMNDFRPPPRFDGLPWRYMEIEESATGTGAGTLIDTKDLSLTPYALDVDPEVPQPRDWTTSNAVLQPGTGWYRVRFRDVPGNFSEYSDWILDALVSWIPTLRDTAVHIRTRTVERTTNVFTGTFTDKTRPTDDQAWDSIMLAVNDVIGETGKLDPAWLSDEGAAAVRALVALRAAMLIERSYFPEQVGTAKSAYAGLERDWERRLPAVVATIAEDKAGDINPDLGGSGGGTGGGTSTPETARDMMVRASSRLYSNAGVWIGSGTAQSDFPDEAPGGTIRGDTKF